MQEYLSFQKQLLPVAGVLLVRCPSLEQVFLGVEPRFFIGVFGELRSDPSLDTGRERLIPVERRFGSSGEGTELQPTRERTRTFGFVKLP